ncbi:C40 family peptidase [Salsuginibacillus kocurii]|uniref:C40 family peptidase n=1 Tax=Salsuginibacillus kocurii TaxID=427078 RepID=UPI00037C7E8F|nr:C40 family peptidase [Salsuginibacillus kocurii]
MPTRTRVLPALLMGGFLLSLHTPAALAGEQEGLLEEATSYKGTPYVYGGTDPSGFDCSGFLNYVYDSAGVDLPRTMADIYNEADSIEHEEPAAGDLVFFETYQPGASHAGIYKGEGEFIHASSSNGVSVDSIDDPYYWEKRYIGAGKVLEREQAEQNVLAELPEGKFTDVPEDHWAHEAIAKLSREDVLSGYENGEFRPDEKMSRAEAAKVVTAVAGIEAANRPSYPDIESDFWAADAIAGIEEEQLLDIEGDRFEAEKAMTRGEVAQLVARAYDYRDKRAELLFSDMEEDSVMAAEVAGLYAAGHVNGYSENEYRPDQFMTRAEIATLIHSIEFK